MSGIVSSKIFSVVSSTTSDLGVNLFFIDSRMLPSPFENDFVSVFALSIFAMAHAGTFPSSATLVH